MDVEREEGCCLWLIVETNCECVKLKEEAEWCLVNPPICLSLSLCLR